MTVKHLCSAWTNFNKAEHNLIVCEFDNSEVNVLFDGCYYDAPFEVLNRNVRSFTNDETCDGIIVEVY